MAADRVAATITAGVRHRWGNAISAISRKAAMLLALWPLG